ncbi:hypothetical protein ACWCQL_37045 [Streptomyces sp. NPDC002073]
MRIVNTFAWPGMSHLLGHLANLLKMIARTESAVQSRSAGRCGQIDPGMPESDFCTRKIQPLRRSLDIGQDLSQTAPEIAATQQANPEAAQAAVRLKRPAPDTGTPGKDAMRVAWAEERLGLAHPSSPCATQPRRRRRARRREDQRRRPHRMRASVDRARSPNEEAHKQHENPLASVRTSEAA